MIKLHTERHADHFKIRVALVVKTCGCGRAYTAAEFLALEAPPMGGEMSDGADGVLVIRNCVCGSTMALTKGI